MAKQGDAYPDPRKMRSGRFTAKTLLCIGLVLMFLGSSLAMVAAPDPFPDPRCVPDPIFSGGSYDNLPGEDSAIGNQMMFTIQ